MDFYCDDVCTFDDNIATKSFQEDFITETMSNVDEVYQHHRGVKEKLFLLVSRTVRDMMKFSGNFKTKLLV